MQNGRVLKIPLTEAETFQIAKERRNIIHGTDEQVASLEVRVQTFMNSKARMPAMINHGFDNPQPFLRLLGDPKLVAVDNILPEDTPEKRWGAARFVYSQEKVEVIRGLLNYLKDQPSISAIDRKKFKRLVEDYITQMYSLWEYGYADYIFKLGDMGIREDGSLVCIDLGEFTSDRQFIERALAEKWWLDNVNPLKADFPKMHASLEPEYIALLESALTPKALNEHWRKKHHCSTCISEADTITAFITTKVMEIDYIDRL